MLKGRGALGFTPLGTKGAAHVGTALVPLLLGCHRQGCSAKIGIGGEISK